CVLNGNIANNFAGGAIFCTAVFEGGFNAAGFIANQRGQFDDIMELDYRFTTRRYHFTDCQGSNNQTTGPSGAGGFLYAVRVSGVAGGVFPLEVVLDGAKTLIGQNTSTFDNASDPPRRARKRGNVVLDLSGQLSGTLPQDRVTLFPDGLPGPAGI